MQNLRKNAGFEIADRIKLYLRGRRRCGSGGAAFAGYVSQDTRATAISDDAPEHGVHSETAQIDGHEVTLAVVRV